MSKYSEQGDIRCHSLLGCGAAVAEAETTNGWVPVCGRCMQTAWDQGLYVRKLQRHGYAPLEADSWDNSDRFWGPSFWDLHLHQ